MKRRYDKKRGEAATLIAYTVGEDIESSVDMTVTVIGYLT